MLMLVNTRDPRYDPEPPDRDRGGSGGARPGWPLVGGIASAVVLVLVAKELPALLGYFVMVAAFAVTVLSVLSLWRHQLAGDAEEGPPC